MKAAVWYGKKDIRIEEVPDKPIKDNEVKVKVAWAGICGSDLHEYQEGPVFIPTDANDPLTDEKPPLTMGHEFSGIVHEVGAKITTAQAGYPVTVYRTLTSGDKREELDPYDGFSFIGLHGDGGFTTYANVPEDNVYQLPETLTLHDGALTEPTAVAVEAVKKADM